MPQGPVDSDLQVLEIDGLGDEIERAAVHRGANVFHVAVCGDYDGAYVGTYFRYLFKEGQAVHLRHVDVGEHHVDALVLIQTLERLDPVPGEDELIPAAPDVAPHTLQYQRLKVRLVVYYQYLVRL